MLRVLFMFTDRKISCDQVCFRRCYELVYKWLTIIMHMNLRGSAESAVVVVGYAQLPMHRIRRLQIRNAAVFPSLSMCEVDIVRNMKSNKTYLFDLDEVQKMKGKGNKILFKSGMY
jgi:hypothetical protein